MTELADRGVTRAKFLRNAAGGGLVLATSSGVLATVAGGAFADGPTDSDIQTLQAAYTAESLAVVFYTAILKNFHTFRHPKLTDRDYFVAALKNEKAHKQFLADALGSKTPTGLRFRIPPKAVRTGQSLLNTGVALETAFVAAYLGASNTLSSPDLRLVAARVAANEASHFSFFDAAAGGHGVLPALPKTDAIPNTVKKLQPFLA